MCGDECKKHGHTGCGGVEHESKRDVAYVRRCAKQEHVCVYNETHHRLNNLITKKNARVPFYLQPQPHRHVHPRPRPHVHVRVRVHVHAQVRAHVHHQKRSWNLRQHLHS